MTIYLADSSPQHQDSPGLEAWRPAALQASSVLLGLVIHAFWPVGIPLAAEFGRIVIVSFLGLSLLIIASSFREFARAKTSVRPDRCANALIRTGPFAYSRNPLYVAVVLMILGIGVWVNSTWIWVMVAPLVLVMNAAVIVREESHLERRFGREYIDYKRAVRRWL